MASLMYDAAYKDLGKDGESKLVSRMRELKEITELEAELLDLHILEDFQLSRQKQKKGGRQAGGNLQVEKLTCLPCGPAPSLK